MKDRGVVFEQPLFAVNVFLSSLSLPSIVFFDKWYCILHLGPLHNVALLGVPQVPDAVTVYRQVLAAQPIADPVAISSIGLLTNLKGLLQSPPDKYSPLNGYDLVAQKVKLLAVMGGKYPNSDGGKGGSNTGGGGGRASAAADTHDKNSSNSGSARTRHLPDDNTADGFDVAESVTGSPECNLCGCYNGADHGSSLTASQASSYVFSHWPVRDCARNATRTGLFSAV